MRDSWKKVTLSDFIDLKHGYQFRDTDFTENGIPIIKIGNVWERGLDLENVTFISKNRYEVFKQYEIKNGDILMSLTGNIGRVVEVRGLSETVLQNYRVGNFYSKDESVLEKHFIKWILGSKTLLKQLEQYSNQSAQANFGKQDLDKLKFNLPPLAQQRKIANILSTADAVIEKTEVAIAKYQQLKQGLMHDLFTRGIDVNTGQLRPKQEDAPELYKMSALGWIPKEWEVEELGDNNLTYAGGTPNRSIEHYYKGTIPWVSSGEVNKDSITDTKEKITHDALKFSSAKMVPSDSVLIALYGATAGQVSMLKIHACTNQAVLAIIPNPDWNRYFIYYGLNFSKERILFLAQGSGQPNLNKGLIDSTDFWKPNLIEQTIISQKLQSIDQKIRTEQQALAKYQQLKAGLMQDLLTGRVEVQV